MDDSSFMELEAYIIGTSLRKRKQSKFANFRDI
jgi:hypothetical protein